MNAKALLLTLTLATAACARTAPTTEVPMGAIDDPGYDVDESVNVRDAAGLKIPGADALGAATFEAAGDGNVVVSPFTTGRAITLTRLAADPGSAAALSRALGLPEDDDELVAGLERRRAKLARRATGAKFADRVYYRDGMTISARARANAAHAFGADFVPFDDPSELRRDVNGWVFDHTSGQIPELMPAGSCSSGTRVVLVDVLDFYAKWQAPFDPARTRPRLFSLSGRGRPTATTSRRLVPTMQIEGRFPFARSEEAAFVALRYADEQSMMIVAVPVNVSLAELERRMFDGLFGRALRSMEAAEGVVFLPKFGVRSRVEVNARALPAPLGPALDDATIDGHGGVVSIHHAAAIDVDEKGTKAAAATAVSTFSVAVPGEVSEPRRPKLRVVDANKPFLFYVIDPDAGVLAFGRVTDPEAPQ